MSSASLGLTDWNLDPTVVLGTVALAGGYLVARRRAWLHADDDVSPWFASPRLRPWLFGAGLASGFVALTSPIDVGGDEYLFWIHMVQHLILMVIAPPLVLLGIAGMRPPDAEALPRMRRVWTAVTRPWPATLLFSVVLLVWHLPQLYNTTLTEAWLHVLEHLTFLGVGVVFWWPIVDPVRGPETRPVGSLMKIAMLVLAGVPPTILGFVFALGRHAYYAFYESAPRLWGFSPVADQQLAGVIMLGIGNLIYFAVISVIFARLFRDPAADEDHDDLEPGATLVHRSAPRAG